MMSRPAAGHPRTARPGGFTLVELLVVIAIIAILASMLLGALYASQEKAREAKTKATVAKLHNLIVQQWESYRTRRIPASPAADPRMAAQKRLVGLWELMRMEMPDSYQDLAFTPSQVPVASLRNAYLRRIANVSAAAQQNEAAECLYLIVTVGMGPDERAEFHEREIGDTDGDGMPEFVDGWGRPIAWVRWPAGFSSESELQSGDPLAEPNPFDPLRLCNSASPSSLPALNPSGSPQVFGFALVPLVVSAGPDGDFGTHFLSHGVPPRPTAAPPSGINSNPYSRYNSGGSNVWRGAPDTSAGTLHHDNIHNHLIEVR